MKDKIFVDTNIWVYLYLENQNKTMQAERIMKENANEIILSTQVLSELYNVLVVKRKQKNKVEAKEIIESLINDFACSGINTEIISVATDIAIKYQYRFYDSVIIATALENDCNILFSEDMQHNQLIENKLKIINPFI